MNPSSLMSQSSYFEAAQKAAGKNKFMRMLNESEMKLSLAPSISKSGPGRQMFERIGKSPSVRLVESIKGCFLHRSTVSALVKIYQHVGKSMLGRKDQMQEATRRWWHRILESCTEFYCWRKHRNGAQ